MKKIIQIFALTCAMTSIFTHAREVKEVAGLPDAFKGAITSKGYAYADYREKLSKSLLKRMIRQDSDGNPFTYVEYTASPWISDYYNSTELEEYMRMVRSYNEANAFEQRRLIPKIKDYALSLSDSDKPFKDMEGLNVLIPVHVSAEFDFNFENMTKTIFVQDYFCVRYFHEFNGGKAEPDKLSLNNESDIYYGVNEPDLKIVMQKDVKYGFCGLEIPFGGNVDTAEKFENAMNEGTLRMFINVKMTGVGYGQHPIAIGNSFVFAEDTAKGYQYLMHIGMKKELLTPSNVLSIAMIKQDYDDRLSKISDFTSIFKGSSAHTTFNDPTLVRLSSDKTSIEILTVGVKSPALRNKGIYARYKMVETEAGVALQLTHKYGGSFPVPEFMRVAKSFDRPALFGAFSYGNYIEYRPIRDNFTKEVSESEWNEIASLIGYSAGKEIAVNYAPTIIGKTLSPQPQSKPVTAKKKSENSAISVEKTESSIVSQEDLFAEKNPEFAQNLACGDIKVKDDGGFMSGQNMLFTAPATGSKDYLLSRFKKWASDEGHELVPSDKPHGVLARQKSGSGFYQTDFWIEGEVLSLHFTTPKLVAGSSSSMKKYYCDVINGF